MDKTTVDLHAESDIEGAYYIYSMIDSNPEMTPEECADNLISKGLIFSDMKQDSILEYLSWTKSKDLSVAMSTSNYLANK